MPTFGKIQEHQTSSCRRSLSGSKPGLRHDAVEYGCRDPPPLGVGNFEGSAGLLRDNQARFQVPTLHNVDKRPYPTFVKAYGHNGYFKSLKSIVHFYNTRDVLARCQPNDPGEGITCWPAPESTDNMNTKRVGRLGLSDDEGGLNRGEARASGSAKAA
jgi:cytochrome c peroxidase